jgi:thioredoxin 1
MAPALRELEHRFSGRLRLGTVNVDESQDLAARYAAHAVPTLVLFSHGRSAARLEGFQSMAVLQRWLEEHLDLR